MEFEEMQAVWSQMSDQIEKQKKLTNKMIVMMTQEKYVNKINRIAYPEMLGAVICYGAALLILIKANTFDNWYTVLSAVISCSILLVLPILSLRSIYRMRKVDIASDTYKETLLVYARSKKQFKKTTKIGYYLSFVLMFAIMPVATKIGNNKDLFSDTKSIWPFVVAVPLAIVFLIVFSRWVWKQYSQNINSAESLLKDLEANDF